MPPKRSAPRRRRPYRKRKVTYKKRPRRRVAQEVKKICANASVGSGSGPNEYDCRFGNENHIDGSGVVHFDTPWPAPPQIGQTGGSNSFLLISEAIIEPLAETSSNLLYPFSGSQRVNSRKITRVFENHRMKITIPSNIKWDIGGGDYGHVSNIKFSIYNIVVPVRLPTTADLRDVGFTMETCKTQIKNLLDNYYQPAEKKVWRTPGTPMPFRVLSQKHYNRKGSLTSDTAVNQFGQHNVMTTFAPIFHAFSFTRNASVWYQTADQDAVANLDNTDMTHRNLSSTKVQYINCTYCLHRSTAPDNIENDDVQTFAADAAPVINYRALYHYTDS